MRTVRVTQHWRVSALRTSQSNSRTKLSTSKELEKVEPVLKRTRKQEKKNRRTRQKQGREWQTQISRREGHTFQQLRSRTGGGSVTGRLKMIMWLRGSC